MEKKTILQLLMPAIAGAALLALILFLVLGPQDPNDNLATVIGHDGKPLSSSSIPESHRAKDKSSTSLSTEMPSLTSPEYRDIGKGLKVYDVVEGEGDPCTHGCTVTAHYAGWVTASGSRFDSSYVGKPSGTPITFSLNGVVAGWSQGLPGMKPGGVRRMIIPSEMGYGAQGTRGIPPGAELIFEVKLCEWK